MSVNNSLSCDPILKFGTDAQKQRWLTPMARGELLGCFALSEPEAGSDAAAQKTVARRVPDGFRLAGTKNFITNGPNARVAVLFAMTDPAQGNKGITAFLVPLDEKGVTLGPPDKKLGIRASQSCQIFLEDVLLPEDAVLGEVGGGFKVAMHTLDGGRIGIAAQAVGIARAAYEEALAYAQEREQFGRSLAKFQAIQFYLADMITELDAARLLTWKAAWAKDRGRRYSLEAAQAKLFASEMAQRVTNKALQIHGGYGYTREYNVERYFRDARITEIYEGTSEIQKMVIAEWVIDRA
jgi:butyryl-CoA dehydrogenase